MPRRLFEILLVGIFVSSLVALLLANEDSFARAAVCLKTGFCPYYPHAKALHKLVYDLAVAAIVSLSFYALVVRLPDYRRRSRVKRRLEMWYRIFRLDCIAILLMVAEGSYDHDLPQTLLDQQKFREYFWRQVAPDRQLWCDFLNNLQPENVRDLLANISIFREGIVYVLDIVDIRDEQCFKYLKRLSHVIYSLKDAIGYDEVKPLEQFLWEVLGGWNIVTAASQEDIMKKMIKAI